MTHSALQGGNAASVKALMGTLVEVSPVGDKIVLVLLLSAFAMLTLTHDFTIVYLTVMTTALRSFIVFAQAGFSLFNSAFYLLFWCCTFCILVFYI